MTSLKYELERAGLHARAVLLSDPAAVEEVMPYLVPSPRLCVLGGASSATAQITSLATLHRRLLGAKIVLLAHVRVNALPLALLGVVSVVIDRDEPETTAMDVAAEVRRQVGVPAAPVRFSSALLRRSALVRANTAESAVRAREIRLKSRALCHANQPA